MKTKHTLTILFSLCITTVFSQAPSININSTRSTNLSGIDKTQLDNIIEKENDLKEEIKKLKSDKKSSTEKEDALKLLADQKQKLLESDYRYKYNNDYYNNRIKIITDKIDKIKIDLDKAKNDENRNRINSYEKEINQLEKEEEALKVEKKRKLNPQANNYSWFLPSVNPEYRNAFFEDTYSNSTDETNYLNSFSLVGSSNGITGQSELVADNMKMFRITFGTVISATNDNMTEESTKIEALQRLLNGGGNFYFDFTLPLTTTIKGNNDDLANLYAFANIKAASDIKGFGNDIDASTYNSSLGLNCYSDISTENRKFNFFVIANTNYYYGCTKEFYKNLDIDHKKGFLSGRVTIGVTLLSQFRFSANVLTYGSEPSLRSEKIGFGVQFLPKL